MPDLDPIDVRILDRLQHDATDTIAALADLVGLSSNACWRRVKMLEAAGVIRQRVALLDAAKLNLGTTVFVSIRTNQHTDSWLKGFSEAVGAIAEVVEFYRMSGKVDYLLKIVVSDIPHYDRVYRRLIRVMNLYDVSSNFAMEQLKCTTVLPLSSAELRA